MKLNLLPTSVSKAGAAKGMIFVSLALGLLGIAVGLILAFTSKAALEGAKADAVAKQQRAADAKVTAEQAEKQIEMAAVINRNQKLSEAMIDHNRKYVDLYTKVLSHVPVYYRLDSISAVPGGENSTTVTLTGYIQSFRQYADLSIALWKIPSVVSVTRAGYQINDPDVPALNETDQVGRAIKPGESPLPSDSMERMEAMISRVSSEPKGFLNQGNFGSNAVTARGAMPGYSQVTMTVVLTDDVRTPDPRATISAGGGAGGSANPPNGFGNVPGGAATSRGR